MCVVSASVSGALASERVELEGPVHENISGWGFKCQSGK